MGKRSRARKKGNEIAGRVRRWLQGQGFWTHQARQAYALIPRGHPRYWSIVKARSKPGEKPPRFVFMPIQEDLWKAFDLGGLNFRRSNRGPVIWLIQATEYSNGSHRRAKVLRMMREAKMPVPRANDRARIDVWAWRARSKGQPGYFACWQLTDRGWKTSWRDREGNPIKRPRGAKPLRKPLMRPFLEEPLKSQGRSGGRGRVRRRPRSAAHRAPADGSGNGAGRVPEAQGSPGQSQEGR